MFRLLATLILFHAEVLGGEARGGPLISGTSERS
jgi:hypothetical protein